MRAPVLAMLLMTAGPLAAATPSTAADDTAVLRWLDASGHVLSSAEPTAADLAPLVARLKGASVIGIGEVTHGTHEDQAFKAMLIKELVKAGGIDALALEANRAAGRGFDRYVRFGEGDPAAAVRSSSFFRIWKGDEFAGLILWLRAWNLAHPEKQIRVFGIDNQDGGVDADLALTFLAKYDAGLAAKLRPTFGTLIPKPGEPKINPSAWIQASKPGEHPAAMVAARALRDALDSGKGKWGNDPDYPEALHAARVAWQNLHEYELEVGQVDLTKLPLDYMARPDRYMAENLTALLEPGERAAFWAHDGHVINDVPEMLAKQGFTSIGWEVGKRLGAQYRTVGFTYSRATILTRRVAGHWLDLSKPTVDEPIAMVNDRPQDVGSVFAKLPGAGRWIDVATAPADPSLRRWLAKPMWRGWVGATLDPANFQPGFKDDTPQPLDKGFDVIVWFRTMTPQHRWPTTPPRPVAAPAPTP